MAYITKEKSKKVKAELKKAFPKIKFSVTIDNCTTLNINIMEAPFKFTDKDYEQLNPYYLNRYQNSEALEQIKSIANQGNYDNSDIQTDYFEVGFYLHMNIGKWDKPFKLV
jgi:hypothetical protein